MKLVCQAGVVLMAFMLAPSQAEEVVIDPSLRVFLTQFEEATSRFINGDPSAWKRDASKRDDVTIMGAWGGYEKGWKEAGARYDAVAGRLKESGARVRVEYLSSGVSGDLAYTVAIERSAVQRVGQDVPVQTALRVTHIFRKEEGAWKLVHRQADPLMEMVTPASVQPK